MTAVSPPLVRLPERQPFPGQTERDAGIWALAVRADSVSSEDGCAPRPGRVAPWPLSQGGGADVNREPAFSLIHNFQVKGFFRKDGINWSKQLYFIYLVKSLYFPIFFNHS